MQRSTTPQDLAELELGLERSRRVPAFRRLLLFFWGLILAKCLFLQWCILEYHAPINGLLFLWTPSVLISGAITVIYARHLFTQLPHMPLSGRLVTATWVACATAMIVLGVAAVIFRQFSPYMLPALAAVLMGVGCYIQSVPDRRVLFKIVAAGWWLAALWLFGQEGDQTLASMALAVFVLQVIPSAWLWLEARRQERPRPHALP